MDEEIEALIVRVRADTAPFARDVSMMRRQLEDGLGDGTARAGRAIERGLGQAIRSGRLGFEDLKRTALAVLGEIAAASVKAGIGSLLGGGGIAGTASRLLGAALGLPGRATGGAVAPGRGYVVGERGPELFVPTSSGRIEAPGGGGREVRVAITVNAPAGGEPQALARSGRQVARAVRAAIERAD